MASKLDFYELQPEKISNVGTVASKFRDFPTFFNLGPGADDIGKINM